MTTEPRVKSVVCPFEGAIFSFEKGNKVSQSTNIFKNRASKIKHKHSTWVKALIQTPLSTYKSNIASALFCVIYRALSSPSFADMRIALSLFFFFLEFPSFFVCCSSSTIKVFTDEKARLCVYCSRELVFLLVWWLLMFLHRPPPPLCNWSSIDKCAPSLTVASRCFNNHVHAQTILCPRITHCFLWRLTLFFYFGHISMTPYTRALWCQPFLSVFRVVHSRSWWLIKLSWPSSFYSIPFFMSREAFFFSISAHWLCCKISPRVHLKLWGALKARYVVLILEEPCLPSECDATLGLAFLLEEQ